MTSDQQEQTSGAAQQQLLEQFTLLAKSLKGRAVVGVIQQALGSKRIFVFAELLGMPNVQALKGTEHEAYLSLLELFCFGRCSDYRASGGTYPSLTEAQSHKLRLLSVLSLCRETRELSYDVIAKEIEADTTRDLEDVLIDAIYLGLVSGKMDQRARLFKVARAASRDVRVEDVARLTTNLQKWAQTANALAAALDRNRQIGIDARQADADAKDLFDGAVSDLKAQLKDTPSQNNQQDNRSNLPNASASVYADYLIGPNAAERSMGLGSSRRVKRSRVPQFK